MEDEETTRTEMVEAISVSLKKKDNDHDELPFLLWPDERQLSDEQQQQQEDIVFARECPCAGEPLRTYFCPTRTNTCGITSDRRVFCYKQNSRTILIRNAWPVIILWYGALTLFLLFTAHGRNARHFCYSLCNRQFNQQMTERILHRRYSPQQRQRRLQRLERRLAPWWRRPAIWVRHYRQNRNDNRQQQQEQQQDDGSQSTRDNNELALEMEMPEHPPNQLALKTTRYQKTSSTTTSSSLSSSPNNTASNNHECECEDDYCTICFVPFQHDERIGSLPCHHTFHVECLKTWLPRRNVCPLCQAPNIAAPQYNANYNNNNNNNSDTGDNADQQSPREQQQQGENVDNQQNNRQGENAGNQQNNNQGEGGLV